MLAMLCIVATACGRLHFDEQLIDENLEVAAVYPLNGANWNDYVVNNGADSLSATDTACTGNETGYAACIHGGQRRQVITDYTSCVALRARDELDAFDWRCKVSANRVVFYARAFAPGRGLKDLVDATAWKPNRIEVSLRGQLVGTSPRSVWWTNPIVPVPTNPSPTDPTLTLDAIDDDGAGPDIAIAAGTILIAQSSITSSGYIIDAHKLALVTLPGVTITYSGNGSSNCFYKAPVRCMLSFDGPRYVWIEGVFDGGFGGGTAAPAQIGLLAEGNDGFARVHQASFLRNADLGITSGVNNSVFDYVTTAFNGTRGIELEAFGFHDLLFSHVASFSNGGSGMYIVSQDNVSVVDSRFANNGGSGLINNSGSNNFVGNVSYSNVIAGISLSGGAGSNPDVTLVNAVAFASEDAMSMSSERVTVLGVTATNSGSSIASSSLAATVALFVGGNVVAHSFLTSNGMLAANLALVGNVIDVGSDSQFTHSLLVTSGAQCETSLTTNPGLADGTCANLNNSSATLRTGVDLTSSFVGKVTSNDSFNASNVGGASSPAAITDWISFENQFRGWGPDGSTFPNADQRGPCTVANCRIWDWRLRADDTMIRNRTGDGVAANGPFVAGQPCPAAVHGDVALDDKQQRLHGYRINAIEIAGDLLGDDDDVCEAAERCFNRFLLNAFEIIDDDVGDDDGLCEANESCLYAPNFGAYQGEGDYASAGTCMFVDGRVHGVKLFSYPINGR